MCLGGTYYTYHTTLLWPWFVTEGMAGLSFYAHFALLIDKVDKLCHKINENRPNLMLLKCIQVWSSK